MLQILHLSSSRIILYGLLFTALFFSSCEKSEGELSSNWELSYNSWLSFKNKYDNTYEYTTIGSSWSGYQWATKLVVKKGKVVERSFEYLRFAGVNKPVEGWGQESIFSILNKMQITETEYEAQFKYAISDELSWNEMGDKVGSKLNSPATKPWNLDEIYNWARTLIHSGNRGHEVYFHVDENLLIKSCGFVIAGCQDDCSQGFEIQKIQF